MKDKRIVYFAAVLALACFASEAAAQTAEHRAPASQNDPAAGAPAPLIKQKIAEEYGKLPLSFEANHGQTDSKVKFLSRGPGYQLFLLPNEAVLTIEKERHAKPAKKFGAFPGVPKGHEWEAGPVETIRMSLLGASSLAEVSGVEQMPGKSNYFIGNDPSQWRTNVPNYAKVQYHGVYPGIDLVYHGSRQQLEYDFIVAPGADPRRIRLALKGAKKRELTSGGDLLLNTSGEPVRLLKPVIYQEFGDKRKLVDGAFVLAAKNTVKFRIGKYDRSKSLIIDPVLAYSTYIGGNGTDQVVSIAVDSTGAAYVTGATTSTDFFTAGAFQTTLQSCGSPPSPCQSAFVAKLNPAGNALVYVTYLGGLGFSFGDGIAVFGGNAYVLGETAAANFPTTSGAFQTTLKGSQNSFVTQLNAVGSGLIFSTYLGGSSSESSGVHLTNGGGSTIAVDANGNAYVTGVTTSRDFPLVAPFQSFAGGGAFNSVDSTTTWSPINSGLTNPNISVLAVDPRTHDVYAGTGSPAKFFNISGGAGVFKSTNGGQTWTLANKGLENVSVQALVIDPTIPVAQRATLYVGGFTGTALLFNSRSIGVFKSVDGGGSWAAMNSGLVIAGTTVVADVEALAIDPNSPGTLYAGGSNGVFKTTNGGTSWAPANTGFPFAASIQALAIDPMASTTIYAGTNDGLGVFKSINAGASWTAMNTGLTLPDGTFQTIQSLAIDAKATSNVYASTFAGQFQGPGLFKSTDGGATWNAASNGLTSLPTQIAVDPTVSGTLYVGSFNGGVFKSANGAGTWTTSSNALSNFNVGALAIDPTTTSTLYAGSNVGKTFITKFGASGTALFSTYLGGSAQEFAGGIATDTQGNVYATGGTESRDFPTSNPFQASPQFGFDAYVTKLNSTGSALMYSTYLGGSDGFTDPFAIAVDGSGSAYVTGQTAASKFPTLNAFQPTKAATIFNAFNAFVTKFDPAGNTISYSTFLGGSGADTGFGIAVDNLKNAWVSGFTVSPDFPVSNPIRASSTGNCFGAGFSCQNIFITELDPTGSKSPFSSYFGPVQSFGSGGIALDSNGNAYVTGSVASPDLPLVNPISPLPANLSSQKGFVLKIATTATSTDLSITLNHTPDPVLVGSNLTFTATVKNNNLAGQAAATGVMVYPSIATGAKNLAILTFSSATPSQGTCDVATGICNLGALAPGATATITLVDPPAVPGTFTAAFGVGGNESDPNPANNVATDTVNVTGGVDLQLLGNTSPVPATAGGTLTYTLFVTNKSGNPASNVTLTDTLPTGFTIAGAAPQTPASQSCQIAGQIVTCLLGSLAAGASTGAGVAGTVPATAGTLTNNAVVNATEGQASPGDNVLQQITDVVAGTGANNPLNARFNGPYAIRFEGVNNGALVAFTGELVAHGNGIIDTGFWDVNTATGVTTNQAFTGSYNVGTDNRMTFTIIPTLATGGQGPAQTFRGALGVLDANNVATKITFVEFDSSGQTGTGTMEPQLTSAFSSMILGTGSFVYRQSGEDANKNHFGTAGQITLTQTTSGQGNVGGFLDGNLAGTLTSNAQFAGTFTIAQTGQPSAGRGTITLTFTVPGAPSVTLNYVFYVVNTNEVYLISIDVRSATVPMSSGFALRQRILQFTNAWFHGPAVFNLSGVTPTGATDVQLGVATGDGAGNLTGLSDENNDGALTLNNPFTNTYTVTQNGRTPITGGSHSPILYLYDLNAGFLVGTDANASVGRAEQQAAGAFSNATFSGPFSIGTLAPSAPGITFISGEGTVNTTGAFTFTEDGNTTAPGVLLNDVVITGTNAFAANGRSSDADGSVTWAVTPTKSYAVTAKSGKTNDTIFVSETGTKPSIALAVTGPATASVAAGAQLTLTYTVSNLSTISATGIALGATQPTGFTLVSATPSQGACNVFVCALGSLASGGTATVTFVLTAPAMPGSTTTTATINETLVDPPVVNPNAANTFVTTSITITSGTVGSADMALVKTVSPTSVIQGANLTYTLTAFNNGPNAATNVTVTDILPAGMTFVPAGSSTTCTGTTTVTCNLGGLAVNASATANIVVTTAAVVPGTITNTATVSADQTDPNTTNNVGVAIATVIPSAATTFEGYILTDVNSPQILEFNASSPTAASIATAHAGTNPDGIAISPNGRLAFVGNVNANYVSVIDLTFNAEIARIRNVHAFRNLALSPDGTRLVVPSANTDELDIIDTSTFQVLNRVNLSTLLGDSPSNPQTGLGSVVVVSHFAYVNTGVTSTSPNTPVVVVDINAGTATVIPNSNVGFPRVHGNTIAATPDGKFVAVPRLSAGTGPSSLLIINTLTNTLVTPILSLPSAPSSITITRNAGDPNGVFGYIQLGPSTIAAVDFRPGSTFGQLVPGGQVTLPDNQNAGSIAITADGTRVIATSKVPGVAHNVDVLDTQHIRTGTTAGAILNQFFVGNPASTVIDSIALAPISQAAPANAPTIGTVSPAFASNSAAIPVHITGTGFGAGALVRVGTLDPIVSTGNATAIDVTVPQFAASQTADIIVTNPNSTSPVFGQQISTIVPQSLVIQPSASFTPANEVAVTNTGDNAVAILNDSTKTVTQTAVSGGPIGMAISADGLRAYPLSFRQNVVDVVNLDSKLKETTIAFAGDTAFVGQVDAIVTAPNIGGTVGVGDPSEFVLTTSLNQTTGVSDLRLVLIDSDPPSPTFNSIVRTLQAGSPDAGAFPGALGVKPDGTFAYGNDANNGDLAIFNLTSGTTTIIPVATIKDAVFQGHVEVTQDGNSLILVSPTGSLLVFDIGANPLSPALLTAITGSTPTGLNAPIFSNFRVVGKNLFAFDGTQNLVEVFNFDRTVAPPKFTQVTSFVVPGHPGIFSSGFAVTPDNNLLYLTLEEDDSMAVLNIPQLLAGSSSPLITTLRTGLLPSAIVISPTKAPVANLSITKTATPTTVAQNTTVTYTITVTNSGPASSTGVIFTDPLPAGLTLVSATASQGTCNGTTTISCSLGQLAVGASASASIVATATTVGSVVNTATVSENETNPSANSSASAQITVTSTSVCPTGTTIRWTGNAADGLWNTAGNWITIPGNVNAVPGASDDACIDTPSAATTVTLSNTAASVHSLVSAANFALNFTSLTLAANSSFLNSLTLNGTLNSSATVTINGLLTSGGGTLGGNGGGTYIANGGMTSTGGILAVGGTLTNNGSAVFPSSSAIRLTTATTVVNNSAGATLTLNGSSLQPTSTGGGPVVNNAGTLTSTSASSIGVQLTNSGNLVVSNGTLSLSAVYIQNSGATELFNNGSSITTTSPFNIFGGLLEGTGVITGNVHVAGGIISPGFSPGTIGVTGIYSQTALSTYNVEIGGLTAGTQYDQITGPTNGTAQLNGTLNVTLINGFVPVAGNTFTVLTCSGTAPCVTGTFSLLNLPTLPNGLGWAITYNPSSVVLSVTGAPSADLAVVKTANVSTVAAGGPTFSYLITITNNGPSAATGVTLTDTLPAGVTFSSVVANQGTCTGTTTVTCALGTLANSASTQVAILVNPVTAGTVVNTATVASNVTDPNPANNSGSATVQITSGTTADLALTNTAPSTATTGVNFNYTVTVKNNGPAQSTGVTVTDTFPAGLNFVGATASQGPCTFTAPTLTCTVGTMANAATVTVNITVTPTATGTVTDTASVTATTPDPNTANNTASTTTTVSAASGCGTGTIQWTGTAGDNQWATPTNWSNGAVPVATSSVCIGSAFSGSTITIGSLAAANQTIASLVANSTISFTSGPLTVTGPGTFANALNISNGTLTLNGSSTVAGVTNFNGGTLTGTSNVTVSGLLTWSGGAMSGTGVTNANGGMSIPSGQPFLDTRTLNVTGATAFGTPNVLLLQNGAVINNLAGSTWTLVNGNGNGISLNGGTTGTFNNTGTFTTTGAGSSSVGVAFNNSGTVNVNAGTLNLSGGGSCTTTCAGPFNVASGAALNFANGNFALSGAIAGAGTVNFSGATANLTGTYNVSGGTTVSNGTANFTGTLTTAGPLTIAGGTANFSNLGGTVSTSTLNISSGTLTGNSTVNVTGLFTWTGGTMSGTGVTNANGGMSIPSGQPFLDTRTLNVTGATAFGTPNVLLLQNGAVINNLGTWTVTNANGNGISLNGGTTGTFNNGIVFQTTGTGNSVVGVTFNNNGTVNANSGTLAFTGVFNENASSTTRVNGGKISSSTAINLGQAADVTLLGVDPANPPAIVADISNPGARIIPGSFNTPGILSTSGLYSQGASGTFEVNISGTAVGTGYSQLNVGKTATLGGQLFVALLNGFTPASGNSFTILTCAATTPCINGTFAITNFPTLPSGLAWNITYNPTSVVLSVGAATGADVAVTKTASLATTHLGAGTFTYTVTVTNNGPSPATGVTLNDALPAAVQLFSAPVPSQGTCNANTPISCALGTLANGASATVTIQVQPAAVGSPVNTATVSANETDPNPANNSASVTVQILATADLSLTKTAQPNPVNAGSPLTYTLTVTNNGPSPATGVKITDTLPAGATFSSASPPCTGTTTVTCTFATLAVNASATATITVTPTGSGALTNTASVTANEFDPNTANNTSSATVTVTPIADLALTKTASPSPAGIGSNLTYTLIVTNSGPSPATNVNLTDTLPAGSTFVSAVSTQGTCSGTTTVTCAIGTLANAANATVTIIVKPVAAGSLTNTASVAGTETDPNPANNTASVTTTVTASADLAVTKTASLAATHLGAGTFTYTVTVTNNGPSPATGVTLNDALPAAVQLFSAPVPSQGTCNANTPISCALGTLANGASATVSIQVQAVAVGAPVNTATVSANETDPNPANNSSSVTVQILATADLSLTKTAQPNSVNAGSPLTYTLTVTNNGPSPATGVKITDTLPAGATFASASPACTGTTTVTCTFATLAVNTSATVTITVTPTGSGALTNTANATANEFDPNTANNTSSATVTITPIADLALTKTASPSPTGIGSNLTYTLTVTNNGPSPATGITLTDTLPAGVTFVSAASSQGTCTTTVSCNLGTLANTAKATVTIVVKPTAAGTLTNTASVAANETDPVPGNNTATVSTTVNASADLALTETVGSPVLLGANLTYTLTITNNGPSPANNVVLTDTLPANATFIGTTPSQGTCTNPLTTCALGNLASGASATVIVVVKPNAAGTFTNSANVTATEADPNTANNSASASATVNPAADLSLAETVTPQTVNLGSNVTFSFTVTNSGPSTATGVTLTDTLPAGFVLVSATPSQGTCTTAVSCNFGSLANGASATLSIVAKAIAAGNFNNTANVSANEADPFPSNNTAIASVTVVASADLAIAVSASPNPAGVGVNLTFTIAVTNNGPSPATNVAVTGTFTAGATFVSFTPSQGNCQGTTQFSCSLGPLSAGSNATVTVSLKPTVAGTLTTTDTVTASEPDPVPANNSATLSVNVLSSPVVTLSPTSLNYASQPVGTPSTTQSVTLTNTSSALPLTSLTISASGDFAQTSNCGSGLAALSSCSILVTFTPTATGTRTGAIMISDNAVGSPQTVSLTGIGINAPAITLSPGSLVFSSRLVGTSSPPLPISMSNSGNATLNLASIAITGTNAGDFSQTNTCGQTLAPGASCTISVVFNPTAGGQRTAGVAVTSDARGSVPVVTLSGTGLSAGLDLSTSLLIFDNQTVGTTSATQTVTLSNGGATAVALTSITASGDFAQTNNCNNSVAASSNCAIRVAFTPTATGTRTGSISIVSGSSTPLMVNLTGTGVVVTLSLSPASLTFKDQKVGTSSQAQTIVLTNTGGATLTITSITPSGDFLEADNCGTGLAAGAGCSINVNFQPTTTGTRTGSITVTSNAQGSPQSAMLTGNGISTGPAVSLSCSTGSGSGGGSIALRGAAQRISSAVTATTSCTSLTFPAQAVGTTSAAQQVTVTNIGNETLNITGIAPSGDFAASSGCPASLPASSSCTVTVTFTPTTTGTRAGSLIINDNAGDSPQSISLTGTGTPSGPAINLSATALPFGSQLLGTTSNAQIVTVNNSGNATLTFTSIKASGDFAETDTCASGVPANSSCMISVTFTPTATGARAGAITISDNAPGSPQAVTLSGEGTDITISVPPGGSTSATVSAGQSASFQLSFAPSGGFSGPVTVTCNSSIPAGTCLSTPASFTLDAPVTVTTTVTTTAPSHSTVLRVPPLSPRNFAPLRAMIQILLLVAFVVFLVATLRRRRAWMAVTAGLFLVGFVSGCAGGSGNPGVVGPTLGTPPNTYTVTVVVKTASGATRSMPLTVIVH